MIEARDFVDACLKREFSVWSGVPCQHLTPLIHSASQSRNLDYLCATSEREALAIAAGAYLGGRLGVVLCENSGLGNMIDPLASLSFPYRIPVLLVVTHCGSGSPGDGPQHELMGRITCQLLQRLRIETEPFPESREEIGAALSRAQECIESNGLPYALVVRRPVVSEHPAPALAEGAKPARCEPAGEFQRDPAERMQRIEAIRCVREALSGSEALIATSGNTCRDLFSTGHRSSHFYVLGAMGCASAIALGVQRARRDRDVVVLDGDGAALMGLGSFATVGHYAPRRYTHILFDNEVHASTGGQPTVSTTVDFAALAVSCGYRNVWSSDEPRDLAEQIREAHRAPGPRFIHVKISAAQETELAPPRLSPHQIKAQFMDWIQGL